MSELPDQEEIVVEDEANEASGAAGAPRRLSDAVFAEIRELYELGKAGLSELASEYKVSRQALSRRFKDVGAVKGSRAHELATAAKSAATAATSSSAAATIERFSEKRADWIEETRVQGMRALKQTKLIAQKVVLDQVKLGAPLRAVDDDLKTVQRLNKILIDNIAASIDLLRANEFVDASTLPVLTIEDLTNEDILEHHKNIGALPDDATIEDMLAEETDPEEDRGL